MQKLSLLILSALFIASCTPRGAQEEQAMHTTLEQYGKAIAQKQKMQLLIVGDITESTDTLYCLTLRSEERLKLNQGRILAANNVQEFVTMLRSSPAIRRYITFWRAREAFYSEEVSLPEVGYKIAFWDKNIDRPFKPYLAEILFVNSTFYYFEADPITQQLQLVFSEPYESALRYRDKQK